MNLEALRKKRVKRLNAKVQTWMGARRIFFILDRATRKFHGDIGLWMQYIAFARKENATKVLNKAFSTCLRLHPAKPELWIYAAQTSIDLHGDMTEARSYMQRGLRFNKKSEHLWLEYTKLELVYISKILTRRKLLGIDAKRAQEQQELGDETSDIMKLPTITAEDMDESLKKDISIEHLALENLETNPALNGAVPLAVFDQAMQEVPAEPEFAVQFWDLFAEFYNLHCYKPLLQHVYNHIHSKFPASGLSKAVELEFPVLVAPVDGVQFIASLSGFVSRLGKPDGLDDNGRVKQFYTHVVKFISAFLGRHGSSLDPAAKVVLEDQLVKSCKKLEEKRQLSSVVYIAWAQLQAERGRKDLATAIMTRAMEEFPNDKKLRAVVDKRLR